MKCSFKKCHSKELSVENREVFASMFFRKEKSNAGLDILTPDGHRFVCKFHFNLLKRIRKPLVGLLYGKREQYEPQRRRYNNWKPKKSNQGTSNPNGNVIQSITNENKSEVSK